MDKRQVFTFILITWMLAVVLYGQSGNGQSAGRNNRRRRPAINRRRVHGMNADLRRAYLLALNRPATTTTPIPTSSTTTGPDLSAFGIIPSLPEPHETECFVEIRVTQLKRGTCIRPGGSMRRPFMCQSGMYLGVDPTCQRVIENRIIQQHYLEQSILVE